MVTAIELYTFCNNREQRPCSAVKMGIPGNVEVSCLAKQEGVFGCPPNWAADLTGPHILISIDFQ